MIDIYTETDNNCYLVYTNLLILLISHCQHHGSIDCYHYCHDQDLYFYDNAHDHYNDDIDAMIKKK